MDPKPTIDAMRTAAQTLTSGDTRAQLHALQAAEDAIHAQKALLLAELDASKGFELDGASTLNTWVRNELRMNSGAASTLVKNVTALRDLPQLAQAAFAGHVSSAHVRVFAYGLQHVGLEPMRQFEEVFVEVAQEHAPSELFEAVKHLKDKVHPEDLDAAWERGMDREDFCVDAVPDGWHISGFLNTVTGSKLKKVLDSVSAPRDKDDVRTGSERRVQGLDDLLSSVLGNGLPSDKGVKPHMSVFVDADTLQAAAEHVQATTEHPHLIPDPMPEVEPATLAGHGAIGPNLLMYFLCVSDFTAFLMKQGGGQRQAQILNAGTGRYKPTLTQRRAVIARQRVSAPHQAATTPIYRFTTPSSGQWADPQTSTSSSDSASDATTSCTAVCSTSPATPSTDSTSPTATTNPSADEEAPTAKPPNPRVRRPTGTPPTG